MRKRRVYGEVTKRFYRSEMVDCPKCGTRNRVEDSDELQTWVLDPAGRIRAARASVNQPIAVEPRSAHCRLSSNPQNGVHYDEDFQRSLIRPDASWLLEDHLCCPTPAMAPEWRC